MSYTSQLRENLKKIPGIRKIIYWLGFRSQGNWLFTKSVMMWIIDPEYKKQLPFLYRIFSLYCQIQFSILNKENIYGANYLFGLFSNLQKLISPQPSAVLNLPNHEVYLDLHDPRFLQVVNELNGAGNTGLLSSVISQGTTFIDVGANQGAYSRVACKLVGETGQVITIEPQPQFARNIKKSFCIDAKLCKFQVHQIAVGDHDGTIDLLVPKSYSGTAGIFNEHSGTHRHTKLKVPIKRFDDAIDWKSFSKPVFIKLDIEGSEFAFLKGARDMLETMKPIILMEINPSSLSASKTGSVEMISLLTEVGYTKYRYLNNLNHYYPIEEINIIKQCDILLS